MTSECAVIVPVQYEAKSDDRRHPKVPSDHQPTSEEVDEPSISTRTPRLLGLEKVTPEPWDKNPRRLQAFLIWSRVWSRRRLELVRNFRPGVRLRCCRLGEIELGMTLQGIRKLWNIGKREIPWWVVSVRSIYELRCCRLVKGDEVCRAVENVVTLCGKQLGQYLQL